MPASQHHRSAVAAGTGVPCSVSPTISAGLASGSLVTSMMAVMAGTLRPLPVSPAAVAWRMSSRRASWRRCAGVLLTLVAVGVGCGFLGAVDLAGAAVDGVADDLAGFGGEVGVAAPRAVEQRRDVQGPLLVLACGAFFFAVGVDQRPPAGQHDGDLVDAHGLHLLDQEPPPPRRRRRGGPSRGRRGAAPSRNPRSPDRNAFSVIGIDRRPRATRISPDTAPRACSVRAATHPGPDWAPSAAHATRASHTPNSATRPAASRFHAASSSTSSSDNEASGSSPGQSARQRVGRRTHRPPGHAPPPSRREAGPRRSGGHRSCVRVYPPLPINSNPRIRAVSAIPEAAKPRRFWGRKCALGAPIRPQNEGRPGSEQGGADRLGHEAAVAVGRPASPDDEQLVQLR